MVDANLRGRDAACLGENADRVDIGELALVGRHAVGGVALGKLDMAVTFARGEARSVRCHVVLEVHESLGAVNAP